MPEPLARAGDVAIGDTITLRAYTQDQIDAVLIGGAFPEKAEGPRVPLRVVGITREPQDLSIQGSGGGVLYTTREFVRRYDDQIGTFAHAVLLVRVTDDAAGRAFVQEARKLVAPLGQSGEFQVQPPSETEGAVQQSIDVLGQRALGVRARGRVGRDRRHRDRAAPVRRRLGRGCACAARARRHAPGARRGARAAARSGGGRRRDRRRRRRVVGVAAHAARHRAGRRAPPGPRCRRARAGRRARRLRRCRRRARRTRLAGGGAVRAHERDHAEVPSCRPRSRAAMRAGSPPPVTVGVAMALEPGRGRSAVPVRPAIVGAIVAVLGVVAVGVFGASLAHLVSTPAAYGYNWDAHFTSAAPQPLDPDAPCSSLHSTLVDDHAVAAAAALCSNTVEVDGHAVGAYGLVPLSGVIEPVVLDGRLPRTEREVALGSGTIDEVQADLGDQVEIAGPEAHEAFPCGRSGRPPDVRHRQRRAVGGRRRDPHRDGARVAQRPGRPLVGGLRWCGGSPAPTWPPPARESPSSPATSVARGPRPSRSK